jgi:hypothetical protein
MAADRAGWLTDHYDFQILGRWEVDRGPCWDMTSWHLGPM